MSGNGHGNGKGHGKKGHGKEEDPVKKWEKLDEQVDRIVATLNLEHSEAYVKGARAALEEDGKINLERLKEEEHQEKFVDAMADHYLSSAKKALGIKEGGPSKDKPLEADMLLNAVHGYTRTQLMQQVRTRRHNYTLQHHEGVRNEIMENVEGRLRGSAAAHLKDSHKEGLVKYAKAHDFLDHDKMRLEEAVNVAHLYRLQGTVSPKAYEGRVFYKKKEEKKAAAH